MKKSFVFVVAVVLSLTSFAQGQKTELKGVLEGYMALLNEGDLVKTVDFMFPKFFEYVPKDALKKQMDGAFESEEVSITIKDPKIVDIEEPKKIGEAFYSLISYTMIMDIQLKGEKEEVDEEDEDSFDADEFTYQIYANMYGEDNVEWDKEARKFVCKANSVMFGIKDPAYGNTWTFMEQKAGLKAALPDLFSDEVWNYYETEK